MDAEHLDLPGGPAPRTVPQDPESVEDERAVRDAFAQRRAVLVEDVRVRVGDVIDLLEVAFHPQNPSSDHPSDVVRRWAERSEQLREKLEAGARQAREEGLID